MKKKKVFFIALLVIIYIGCELKNNRVVKRTTRKIKKRKTVAKKPVVRKIKPAVVSIDKFNGVIEDFEKDLKYWHYSRRNDTSLKKLPVNSQNIGIFEFNAPYSAEEFHSHINYIVYRRKMDFSPFKGIKFKAKGHVAGFYKIKILEKEDFYPGHNVQEVWYERFRVNNTWQNYKILFSSMGVEEYYEQNYVSDNVQTFANIIGVCITAQNISIKGSIKGKIFVDDIKLF